MRPRAHRAPSLGVTTAGTVKASAARVPLAYSANLPKTGLLRWRAITLARASASWGMRLQAIRPVSSGVTTGQTARVSGARVQSAYSADRPRASASRGKWPRAIARRPASFGRHLGTFEGHGVRGEGPIGVSGKGTPGVDGICTASGGSSGEPAGELAGVRGNAAG